MLEIKKIDLDGIELLPNIVDTPLWTLLDPDHNFHSKKSERQLAGLYEAICKRENYYQENTPTAFGDPQYSLYCGVVKGFLQAMEADESVEDGRIVIRKAQSNKKLLVVDKLNRPQSYYEQRKANKEALEALGF